MSAGTVSVRRGNYAKMEKKLTRAIDDYDNEILTVKGFLDIAGTLLKLGNLN